jgi:hypothetical protein
MEKPQECIICLEKLNDADNALQCGHWIHISCIQKQFKPECPVCRAPLNIKVFGKLVVNIYNNESGDDNDDFTSDSDILDESSSNEYDETNSQDYLDYNERIVRNEDDENYDEENPYGDEWFYEYV